MEQRTEKKKHLNHCSWRGEIKGDDNIIGEKDAGRKRGYERL